MSMRSPNLGNHRTAKAPWRLSDGKRKKVTTRKLGEESPLAPWEQAILADEHVTEPGIVRLPDRSHNENLPSGMGTWTECGFATCGFGCKVYSNGAGREVVGHNSAYGCRS